MNNIEVLFSPAEFEALAKRNLSETTCVVFDILRATSAIVTALANGVQAVLPVQTIEQAVEKKRQDPDLLLAGEREGFKITSQLTGSINFDFGNSPREFASGGARGRTIVMTTTNGTRALKACSGAQRILVGSFLNLAATIAYLRAVPMEDLILVCSGTHEEASLEDTLAAGAVAQELMPRTKRAADSAHIAQRVYQAMSPDLEYAMTYARNGRRLLEIPELREDVRFCLQQNIYPMIAHMETDGRVVPLKSRND